MKKFWALLTIAAMAATMMISSVAVAAEEEAEPYKIGVSVPTMEMTFFAFMEEELNNAYPTDKAEVTLYDGEDNQEKQNSDVEDMITMGYDGIVIIPITVEGAIPAIEYANEKGVPVICVDREITPDTGVETIGFVGSDHVPMGEGAAELMVEALEKMFPDNETWKVVEIEGTQGASATLKRGEGIHHVFDENPKVDVIAQMDGQFLTTTALTIAEDYLTSVDDLNGFICHNDDEAMGCLQALKNANRVGDVAIVGIDGTKVCVEAIAAGEIQGTIIQYPAMVCLGVETMVKYLDGEEIEYTNYYPTDMIHPEEAQQFLDEGKPY